MIVKLTIYFDDESAKQEGTVARVKKNPVGA